MSQQEHKPSQAGPMIQSSAIWREMAVGIASETLTAPGCAISRERGMAVRPERASSAQFGAAKQGFVSNAISGGGI